MAMRGITAIVAGLVLGCGQPAVARSAAAAAQTPAAFGPAWRAAVSRYERLATEQRVVGSSLLFAHNGAPIGAAHFGLADAASGRRVDAETIFHWASVTKTFTAVAAMQLVERGLISLDDPVVRYLPEVRQVHNRFGSMESVTLRQLISHSAGFRSPTFPWGGDQPWHPFEPTHWSQVAAMMPYTEILFAPGSRFSYSNLGVSMLGRVIEEVSGEDIGIYIAKNIFMPLGMSRSYFDVTPPFLLGDRSNNYDIRGGKPVADALDFDTGATKGNGGINAPVGDMLKWANFWLGVGDTANHASVLKRATLEAMWRPLLPAPDPDPTVEQQVGLGFFMIDQVPADGGAKRRYVGHTGEQKGFTAFIYVDPETKTAAIFNSNTLDRTMSEPQWLRDRTRRDLFESVFPLFWMKGAGAGRH
jgi:CubicO group peptidase (beta-lactamase class C family)